MRRPLGLALSVAVLATAGLVRAADPEASDADTGKIGAFSQSAVPFARSAPSAETSASSAEAAPANAAQPATAGAPAPEAGAAAGGATGGAPAQPANVAAMTSASPDEGGENAKPQAAVGENRNAEPAASVVTPAVSADAKPQAGELPLPGVQLVPAKQLFGAVKSAAPIAARAIGSYSRGCLAGAKALPVDGPQWQAMRLSRNRNWGHPDLIQLIQRLSDETWRYDGWNGLLVGDISQPRGGPMLTGHASHQLGLDADIWLTPMPDRRLTNKEREDLSATSMIGTDDVHIDAKVWTPAHVKIIKRVASYDRVERVLVHPGIKEALCTATAGDGDRKWLSKVRPYWGHNYHFHVRIGCPQGSAGCTAQAPTPGDDGCGKELAEWLARVTPKPPEPKPPGPVAPAKPPPPPVTLADMPQECRVVLTTGTPGIPKPLLERQRQADIALAQRAKALASAQAAKHAAAAKANAATSPAVAGGTAAQAKTAAPAAASTAGGAGAKAAAASSSAPNASPLTDPTTKP